MSLNFPPRVKLTWTPTSLTTAFGEYRVYRRPTRTPAPAWEQIAAITVPSGYTATNVEAQHASFIDYEAGWASPDATQPGQWQDGWDYAVTVWNAAERSESPVSSLTGVVVAGDANPWAVSNVAPYLNLPLERVSRASVRDDDYLFADRTAGRDELVTRVSLDLPAKRLAVQWKTFKLVGEDQVRGWRAATASGRAVCLHRPVGDRTIGAAGAMSIDENEEDLYLTADMTLVETARASALADYNLGAGLTLNGSSQYVSTPTNALLNPGSDAFTLFLLATLPNSGDVAVGRGDTASGQGYWIFRNASNSWRFTATGASATADATYASASVADGNPHVLIGTSTGAAQSLYVDGTEQATDTTAHGALSNSKALVLGANNDGASGFLALAPGQAWGYYPRALTQQEVTALTNYLTGVPGYRAPAGARAFYDLRDDRAWPGSGVTIKDLSGNDLDGTVVAAPATRGIPWSLRLLDRF